VFGQIARQVAQASLSSTMFIIAFTGEQGG
jgi:hypothetical protein